MKIRAKKGYNIVLNDLKIALSSNGKSVEIDEEQFKSSVDAKQLNKFIEIVDNEDDTPVINSNPVLRATKAADQAFVIGELDSNKPIGNGIVMDPNNTISQPIKKAVKTEKSIVINAEQKKTEPKTEAEVKNESKVEVKNENNELKQLVKKAKAKKFDEDNLKEEKK